MTLHVDSSTIRNQTVLAHVLDPVDPSTDGDSGSGGQVGHVERHDRQRRDLAERPAARRDERRPVRRAERDRRRRVVRALAVESIAKSSTSAAALHGSIDRSRAAALLVDWG